MAKIKLKKSLLVVLERSKQALVKSITEAMSKQATPENEITWLLLEFTLQYPFPPIIGLAQTKEVEQYADSDEHPLICYNAADLELFSENQTIIVDFSAYDTLFETADQLLDEIEYEDRQPFIFQLYVEVCKVLMLESSKWAHLKLSNNFHVTARDYEICDEAKYLKKLLPKKTFNKIQQKLDAYDARINDEYANDETILKVQAVIQEQENQYDALLTTLTLNAYTDVYTLDEIYFLRPYQVEIKMHKRPEEIEPELSTQMPTDTSTYYQYKFNNNIPQLVDFYLNGKLFWRNIFQYKEDETTSHKFLLKNGIPEIKDYAILRKNSSGKLTYEEYSNGHYNEMVYHKNDQDQIVASTYISSMFHAGYKNVFTFEYIFEYKNQDLFKISCVNQKKQSIVYYCKDDSFMEEAIEAYVEHICTFAIAKMKKLSLDNLDAVVMEYDNSLPFYFNIYLVYGEDMVNISTYEQYKDDSAMMNMTVYTAVSSRSHYLEYFSTEKAEAYERETYMRLYATLEERIKDNFQISVPVVTKYIHDDLDL